MPRQRNGSWPAVPGWTGSRALKHSAGYRLMAVEGVPHQHRLVPCIVSRATEDAVHRTWYIHVRRHPHHLTRDTGAPHKDQLGPCLVLEEQCFNGAGGRAMPPLPEEHLAQRGPAWPRVVGVILLENALQTCKDTRLHAARPTAAPPEFGRKKPITGPSRPIAHRVHVRLSRGTDFVDAPLCFKFCEDLLPRAATQRTASQGRQEHMPLNAVQNHTAAAVPNSPFTQASRSIERIGRPQHPRRSAP